MRGDSASRGEIRVCSDGYLALGAFRLGFEDDPLASNPEAIAAVHGYFFGSRSGSDATVLLDGYREEGEAYLRQLDGEFAFVLWDRRKKTLYLCRDSFGTKPLFYAHDGQRLAVATEIRQVLRSGVVAPSANRSRLAADFGLGQSGTEETLFSGVRRVLPSQFLRFSSELAPEGVVTWAPPTTVDRRRTEEEVLDELPRLLTRSVARRRWRKPAVTLSGGLDSASVAAVVSSDDGLKRIFSAGDGPRAIVFSYPGWDLDETEDAERLARRLSLAPVVLDVTGAGPVETAAELGEICDQPYGPTSYEALLALRELRRLGCESVATGIGAEFSWEILPTLAADLLRQGSWRRLYRETKERVGPNAGTISDFLWHEAVRPWVAEGARRLRRLGQRPDSRFPGVNAWESMMWRSKSIQLTGFQVASFMEFFEQLGVHEGVEMIHPFLDREVVEYAFRTPPQLVGTLTSGKRLLARAMTRRFPGAFGERPKTPGPDDFVNEKLRKTAGRMGFWTDWQLTSILHFDAEDRELLRRISSGEPSGPTVRPWSMICTELWLRRHFPAAGAPAAVPAEMAPA
jgi:asparagine synthetase B (glutamine-hydrolysing)